MLNSPESLNKTGWNMNRHTTKPLSISGKILSIFSAKLYTSTGGISYLVEVTH